MQLYCAKQQIQVARGINIYSRKQGKREAEANKPNIKITRI